MKSGSHRYSNNLAKNYGLSVRAPIVADPLIPIAAKKGDNALTVNSVLSYLYNQVVNGGRDCSCMDYKSVDGSIYSEDSDIQAPVIILSEDDEDQEEMGIAEAMEALETPLELCPVCYGTKTVGGYKLRNSHETFFDTTYPNIIEKYELDVLAGRPFFFRPTSQNSYIVFQVNLPSYFLSLQRVSIATKEEESHSDIDQSLLFIKDPAAASYTAFSEAALGTLLGTVTTIYVKAMITEDTFGIFLRLSLASGKILVNFPKQTDEISGMAEYDWWASVRVSIPSDIPVSTKDFILDTRYNRYWKVVSVDRNQPMDFDIGADVELRPVKDFENFKLIP